MTQADASPSWRERLPKIVVNVERILGPVTVTIERFLRLLRIQTINSVSSSLTDLELQIVNKTKLGAITSKFLYNNTLLSRVSNHTGNF